LQHPTAYGAAAFLRNNTPENDERLLNVVLISYKECHIRRGSIMIKALCYKPEGRDPMRWRFSNYLILSTALGPGVYSASNRNEYRSRKMMFLGSKVRPVRRADNLAAICELIV
jgi:hypothetical protein